MQVHLIQNNRIYEENAAVKALNEAGYKNVTVQYEESFETFIGSLFHSVLEKCFNNNLIVEDEVNNYIKECNKELTIKERFFVNKIIEDIKFTINVLNKQKEYISFDKVLYEKES